MNSLTDENTRDGIFVFSGRGMLHEAWSSKQRTNLRRARDQGELKAKEFIVIGAVWQRSGRVCGDRVKKMQTPLSVGSR